MSLALTHELNAVLGSGINPNGQFSQPPNGVTY